MPMDKEKMGKFVAQLRKEKKMTQKELAEKLFLTDKAISKWERGLSFPDISVLEPLAEVLEVSVLELLEGERVTQEQAMTREDAERLIDQSITISDAEISRKHVVNKTIILIITLLLMLLVTIVLNVWNYSKEEDLRMLSFVLLVVLILQKVRFHNRVLEFLGKFSLEIVLINGLFLELFLKLEVRLGLVPYLVFSLVCTALAATVIYRIKMFILERRS